MSTFSTPSYNRLIERQEEELKKLHKNDMDIFVRMVNVAKKENPVVQMPVSIGVRPEIVDRACKVRKNELDHAHDRGVWGGLMFAGLLVISIVALLIAP